MPTTTRRHYAKAQFQIVLDQPTLISSLGNKAFVRHLDVQFDPTSPERLDFSGSGVAVLKNGKPGNATRNLYVISDSDVPQEIRDFARAEADKFLATFATVSA